MTILAIDPGNEQSAFVLWNGERVRDWRTLPNRNLLGYPFPVDTEAVCIEMVACYGMPVGKEVFQTCLWIGRFIQKYGEARSRLVYRKDIKMHLCGTVQAKDSNIRQALIDRLGKPGTITRKGVTYGIHGDEWAALAVAVYAHDMFKSEALSQINPTSPVTPANEKSNP